MLKSIFTLIIFNYLVFEIALPCKGGLRGAEISNFIKKSKTNYYYGFNSI